MNLDLPTLMKLAVPLVLLAALVLLATGCTTRLGARLATMPDGQFKTATLEQTGKFSSTTIKLTDATKDNGVLQAAHISVSHSNVWVPKFNFEATGYVVQLTPAEKKKALPANPFAAPASVPSASSVLSSDPVAAK